jgi:hypothetical protein
MEQNIYYNIKYMKVRKCLLKMLYATYGFLSLDTSRLADICGCGKFEMWACVMDLGAKELLCERVQNTLSIIESVHLAKFQSVPPKIIQSLLKNQSKTKSCYKRKVKQNRI